MIQSDVWKSVEDIRMIQACVCVCVCELEPLLPVHCLVIPLACCVSPTTMFTFPDGIIFTCE